MSWLTKEGEKIPIENLSDKHLLNIHRMLRQQIEDTKSYTGISGTFWEPRGEMACEAFEQEMEQQMELSYIASIKLIKIQQEIDKRGLAELPLKEPYKPMPKMECITTMIGVIIK